MSDSDDEPEREGTRESLFTLSNGYIATRGARPYACDDGIHYPGTYFAGVYDRSTHGHVADHPIEQEAIVNAPELAVVLVLNRWWTMARCC